MEFDLPSWDDGENGWSLDQPEAKPTKAPAPKNKRKKRPVDQADGDQDPPAPKRTKVDPTPAPVEEKKPTSETENPEEEGMTSSRKRRLRRKQNLARRAKEEQEEKEKAKVQRREKKQKKKSDPADQTSSSKEETATTPSTPEKTPTAPKTRVTAAEKKKASRFDAMKEKLKGGQFRWLNEQLYTTNSTSAMELFSDDPSLFTAYHEGFRNQVQGWPENPVDIYIHYLKRNPSLVVGDFGCGDAKIAQSVSNTVHSFDLQAVNEKVTACDIANVPLGNNTLDVAIYSLSLMGTNYLEFLKEAYRVLKPKGQLLIAEVRSRFGSIKEFENTLKTIGFDLVSKDDSNTMFILFTFTKGKVKGKKTKVRDYELKPCLYKRR